MKEDEMGRTCAMNGTDEHLQNVGWKLKAKRPSG
jgi:hypothetical protein